MHLYIPYFIPQRDSCRLKIKLDRLALKVEVRVDYKKFLFN